MKNVTIYTDGACSGNPGPGGWGAIMRCGDPSAEKELSGGEPHTTNNRMELLAAIEALEALKRPSRVKVVTDSKYLSMGITEWIHNWQRKGWQTSAKKPVLNKDLWQRLLKAIAPHEVVWEWIKGHSGHPENERCDEMARNEIGRQRKAGGS